MKLTQLREVRELHGWSQSKLAEESGVSRDGISNYETGHREAWPATAKKLADALQAEISDLVARVEEPVLAGKAEAPTSGPSQGITTGPKNPGLSLPQPLLRSRTGHDYITHSLAETLAFAEAASQDEIKARIRDLAEEQAVLREAVRHLPEYVPELFGPSLGDKTPPHAKDVEAVKAAREEIKAVSKRFVVRVMNLAEIGGRKDERNSKALLAEAKRILAAEHAAVLAEA